MRFLALDLSKTRTGYAIWDGESRLPVVGSFNLGDEKASAGEVFKKLYTSLSELSIVHGEEGGCSAWDRIFYEQPLNPNNEYRTTFDTTLLLIGLAGTVHLWASAKCSKITHINVSSWRAHFVGSVPRGPLRDALGNKIKRKPINWKRLTVTRCRDLGLNPRNDDEADAIGLLDYCLHNERIVPPWRRELTLQQQFGNAA